MSDIMPLMSESFPERLQRLRLAHGWSYGQLKIRSGVSRDATFKLEHGQRVKPSADVVARLSSAFGTSMEYLMGVTDNPAPCDLEQVVIPAPAFSELVARLNELPLEEQRRFALVANAILDLMS